MKLSRLSRVTLLGITVLTLLSALTMPVVVALAR